MTVAGLVSVISVDGFGPTVARLDAALAQRAIAPTLRLDHAAAAAAVDLELAPTLLLIFGDPRVGTAMMQAAPTAALDLPLKMLVWQCPGETARVGFNDPDWIRARHGLADLPGLGVRMGEVLRGLAQAAAGL